MKIKKQVIKDWIKALRSNKYKQAHNIMYYSPEKAYCILGILLMVLTGKKKSKIYNKKYVTPDEDYLQQEVIDAINKRQRKTAEKPCDLILELTLLNDEHFMPFHYMAGILEEMLIDKTHTDIKKTTAYKEWRAKENEC